MAQRTALLAVFIATLVPLAASQLPPLPGLFNAAGPDGSMVARGFDPIFQKTRGAVATFHYNNLNGNNNQWTDPTTGQTYAWPDELNLFEEPAAATEIAMQVFGSFEDYLTFMQSQSSTSFGLYVLAFSKSNSASYMQEVLKAKSHVVSFARHITSTFKLSMLASSIMQELMQGGSQADNAFTQMMLALPTSISDDQDNADYAAFIDKFGTHYAESAFYGGSMDVYIVVNSTYVSKVGQSETNSQMSVGLDIIYVAFGFSSSGSHEYGKLTTRFKASSEIVMVAFGGDPALVQNGAYDSWSATLNVNPVPINVTYRDLSDLVFDQTRAPLVQQAANTFLNQPPQKTGICAAPTGFAISGVNIPKPPKTLRFTWEDVEAFAARRAAKNATKPKPKPTKLSAAPVPGANSGIGRGFDAKTGNILLPVTSFGYSQNKQWYDATTSTYYAIPDGLSFEATPTTCFTEDMVTLQNSTAVWNFISHSAGGYIGLAIDNFGVSLNFAQEVQKFQSITNNFTDALTLLQKSMVLYSLSFGDSVFDLDPMLQTAINNLPETQDPAYLQFIQYWGTHYVAEAYFGGYCNFTVAYNQAFAQTKSWTYVSTQVGLSLGYMLDGVGMTLDLGYGITTQKGTVDSQFKSESTSQYMCLGGDVSALQNGDYNLWVQTLNNAPSMIPGTEQLRPISDFVLDINKRALLQQAIVQYLTAS